MKKNITKTALPPRPTERRASAAPTHLDAEERRLWQRIIAENSFADGASLAILTAALEAHARARQCRQIIDRDGPTVVDRFQQTRCHPLLASERDAKSTFIQSMRALGLTGADAND
jgi:P27 family predicted phage terminase small subunit